jgi:hypothetical protein
MLCSGQSTVNSYPGKGADLTGGLSSLLVRSSVRSLFLSLLSVSPELNYYTQSFRAEAPAGEARPLSSALFTVINSGPIGLREESVLLPCPGHG